MSYDLYFTSPKITLEQFNGYFKTRPNYKVENGQAFYENGDTGVYFSFDHNDHPPKDEDDIDHSVSFNINYFRPHYFALEAEPEVTNFIGHFGCSILDYQNDGMDKGPYSGEGFLRGWNHGNDFGYHAVLKQNPPSPTYSLPTEELEHIWRWNYVTESRQQQLTEDIFIPKVFFILVDGKLGSTCVWPDAISTLIPSVDFLYVPRKKLAPKKWFKEPKEDFCIVHRAAYIKILQNYVTNEFELTAFKLPAPDTPKEIKNYIKNQQPFNGKITRIGYDSVLNSELVKKYI